MSDAEYLGLVAKAKAGELLMPAERERLAELAEPAVLAAFVESATPEE